jgi:hypothetical protein
MKRMKCVVSGGVVNEVPSGIVERKCSIAAPVY